MIVQRRGDADSDLSGRQRLVKPEMQAALPAEFQMREAVAPFIDKCGLAIDVKGIIAAIAVISINADRGSAF